LTDEPIISTRDLAREIAAREHELPLTHATGEPYRNAYNALSQTHLPTLAEAGIVIYDPERQTVSAGPNLPLADLLLKIDRPTVATFYKWNIDDGKDVL
jgi:hydroxymethylpyrimidine pyrophosphatase-like HAD family hydrolase